MFDNSITNVFKNLNPLKLVNSFFSLFSIPDLVSLSCSSELQERKIAVFKNLHNV